MKVFISQPMNGKTDKEIMEERQRIMDYVTDTTEAEFIDSFIKTQPNSKNTSLWCLGRSLEMMAEADLVIFAPNYADARGCRIEHACAKNYGIATVELPEKF